MYLNGYHVEKNEGIAFRIYMHCLDIITDETAPDAAGPLFLRLGKAFLDGTGTDKDARSAMNCFQKAEQYLYDMVHDGDVMYRHSLEEAVEGQEKARELLRLELPSDLWTDEVKP
jgi:TPR repeat protein